MEFINKLKNNKLFDELYILILALIILFSWDWFFTLGTAIVIVISAITMILFNNFKYLLPAGLFFVFSNRDGYSSDKIPYEFVISLALLIAAVIYYMVRNKDKVKIKNAKSALGLGLLAIAEFIPIFWSNIPSDSPSYYFLYLGYLLYFVIYIFYAINLGNDSFKMCKISIIYLGMLLAFECMSEIYTLKVNYPNLQLSSITYYSLGWGCCNEAGIMMLLAFPFLFIDYASKKTPIAYVINTIKLLIIGLGIIFTYSRGAYLFGLIELVFLLIYTLFHTKNIKAYVFTMLFIVIILFVGVEVFFTWKVFLKDIVINGVFNARLNDSNRFELWSNAVSIYSKDYVTLTFGSGVVSEFIMSNIRNGSVITQVVYHSTFFQILVTAGNFGFVFLLIHFFEKYYNLKFAYNNKCIFVYLLTAYIAVDIYGLMDNTYGMYYFMIPLVLIMASFDSSDALGVDYE